MSTIATGFHELPDILRTKFGSGLTMLVARIAEVHPFTARTGGSEQQVRLALAIGGVIDMRIYDRSPAIEQSQQGWVIKVTASPNTTTAFVWERSKAVAPKHNQGVLVVRKQAHVQIVSAGQAKQLGWTEHGFTLPAPTAETDPLFTQPEAAKTPVRVAPSSPVAPVPTPSPSLAAVDATDAEIVNLTRRFVKCLNSAKAELGPKGDPEDARATARAVYERIG